MPISKTYEAATLCHTPMLLPHTFLLQSRHIPHSISTALQIPKPGDRKQKLRKPLHKQCFRSFFCRFMVNVKSHHCPISKGL